MGGVSSNSGKSQRYEEFSLETLAALSRVSERTIRYHPHLPRVQISLGRYGQRVGDIRKLCREGMPRERGAA